MCCCNCSCCTCCNCCAAKPNQSHLALTINSGILLVLFTIMSCVMVSTTHDYKLVKAYIEMHQHIKLGDYTILKDNEYLKSVALSDLSVNYNTNSLRYANLFINLKNYEMGIIITRLIVMALIFGCLIYECILENKKTLPTNGVLYDIFIGVYIFQIVFHVIFAILSVVLGAVEILAMTQYGLLLPSDADVSGPIVSRGSTQIAFTDFFFVYQLVFVCLVVPIFGMFRRKELVGQGFDPYKKGASNSATSREINPGSQNVIKKINE